MNEQTCDNNNASSIENDDAALLMIKLFILLLLSGARGFLGVQISIKEFSKNFQFL